MGACAAVAPIALRVRAKRAALHEATAGLDGSIAAIVAARTAARFCLAAFAGLGSIGVAVRRIAASGRPGACRSGCAASTAGPGGTRRRRRVTCAASTAGPDGTRRRRRVTGGIRFPVADAVVENGVTSDTDEDGQGGDSSFQNARNHLYQFAFNAMPLGPTPSCVVADPVDTLGAVSHSAAAPPTPAIPTMNATVDTFPAALASFMRSTP